MTEIEIAGHKYKTGRLDAKKQLKIAKRLMPFLDDLRKSAKDLPPMKEGVEIAPENAEVFLNNISGALAGAIAGISDDDLDYITDTCLAACERASGGGWAPVMRGPNLMFQDLSFTELIGLSVAVIRDNLGDFFSSDPLASSVPVTPQK